MDTIEDLWQNALAYCKERLNSTAFKLWLSKIEIVGFDNSEATLKFENLFKKRRLSNNTGI